ncbi:glycosyl hydrolase family 18 protein [Stenotrophomonas sp.]|uniref:glycosyl hydrolase family 18 protein n=1 Tax=Stenotrophomonas sp. TaxID=69392 RepID=UPI0028A58846|nr:glycosyl hydrolase family 18 protein [Stenotrophomonas sp.]
MTDHPTGPARPRYTRQHRHGARLGWTLALVFASASGLPAAQAANCAGVGPWLGTTIYQSGDTLQKDGVLYKARQTIWNAPPDHPAGRHYYDNLGRCVDGAPAANQPPQVHLTSPSAGSTFSAGSTITFKAAATDSDGSIRKVEFFRNGHSVGSVSSAPYSLAWRNAAAGNYLLSAVATDDRNASTTSATVSVTVTAPDKDSTAPSIPDGLSVQARTPTSIALRWNTASDNPGGSGIAAYDLYRDGTQIASIAATGHTDTALTPATGYRYAVRARDKAGNASALSAMVSVSTLAEDAGGTGPGGPGDPGTPSDGSKRVIGYFTQWGIYGRNYRVKNIDSSGSAARLTHINYAFGNVRNNRCEVGITHAADPASGAGGDAYADYTRSVGASESVSGVADQWNQPLRGNWNQLKQLKAKYPQLKTLISLGGWTWSRGFSSAARPENRQAFVASCIDAYIKGNLPFTDNAGGKGVAAGVFDGIDIDWEYPAACGLACGTSADRDNFTALLAEFRRQLDAVRPGLLLTVAVGAGIDKIRPTDPAAYHRYLDFINVMTYDFHGAWAGTTNHHSALFHSPADPSTGDAALYNSNDTIEAYLQRGVPAAKLNLGVGFYGRGWTGVARTNNGLYQSGRPAAGKYEAGIEDWKVLKNLGWPVHTDPLAQATWLYDGNTFWSVDTPEMLGRKMAYIKAQGLGGAFFWEFSGDDAQGTLVNSIGNGLK